MIDQSQRKRIDVKDAQKNERDLSEDEEDESPDPFFTAITRSRIVILVTVCVFLFLGALEFIGFWTGLVGVLTITTASLASAWPKEIKQISPEPHLIQTAPSPGFDASTLIEAIPDPILALDPSGNILFFNESAKDMLGSLERDQHISAAIRAPNVLDAIDLVKAGADPVRVSYDQRGDIERNFDVHIASLQGDEAHRSEGRQIAMLLVLGDLTQQERIESMRADFVANVSHELRTPLASLLGFIETIKGSARHDKKARDKFLDIMHDQAERMTRLINDLLSLSRIEMNVHQPPSDIVDVRGVIDHVAEVLSPMARKHKIKINIAQSTELTSVPGERDELVQVFQNLIENAIKYGAKGKKVDISLNNGPEDELCVSVQDYGPGIAPENLPRLTERFYRVDVLESREKGGTGLGLAIVKHILNRHRAQLTIKSKLRDGSEFSVFFPRQNM